MSIEPSIILSGTDPDIAHVAVTTTLAAATGRGGGSPARMPHPASEQPSALRTTSQPTIFKRPQNN